MIHLPYIWWRDTGTPKLALETGIGKYGMWFKLCFWKKFLMIGYDF